MKKTGLILLCLCLIVAPLGGCGGQADQTKSYFLMDTVITVTVLETDADTAAPIFERCGEILGEYDALWSRTKAESDVARINRGEMSEIDPRTVSLIKQAISISRETNGAFDITVAPLVDLWKSCETDGRLPTEAELETCLALVGTEQIFVENGAVHKQNAGVSIDLGGIGKGAAIDALITYLESCEVQGGIVSFGSNVAVFGEKPSGEPFRVAIKDPKNTSGIVGSLTLEGGEVLSVSGDYERYVTIDGRKYHHILSPQTGYPAETGLSSVAVITKNGAYADALSTALFVMGETAARALCHSSMDRIDAVFIANDGTVTYTDGISGADFK
ncbi:MAG: FAD:protein FMN transferase [Clostridia bacterium]|nr:FAD:protein FMN transferase [Clostridia bacterium]